MRKRYNHNIPIELLRIRNRFSHRYSTDAANTDLPDNDASNQAPLRPILLEENDDMDVQYNYDDDDDMGIQHNHEEEEDNDEEEGDDDDDDEEEEEENDDDDEDDDEDEEEYEDEHEDDEDSDYNDESEEEDDYNDEVDKDSDDEEIEDSDDKSENNNGDNNENDNIDHEGNSRDHQITDKALDKDKMPLYDGEFAPYFQNFTTAALFCWVQKHNISTNSYEDLVDIIMNSEFNGNHVVRNIRRFRTWRQHLPLLSMSENFISILSKKTPSTSKSSKKAYQLSISDIIWHVLNNPSLFKHMYFGPGVNSEVKSEYWHGTLWGESPLFGEDQIIISEMEYKCGDFVYYDNNNKLGRLRSILKNDNDQYQLRIQKVTNYDDLPEVFKGSLRQRRSLASEVWLKDEFQIITTSQISGKASVMIEFQHQDISENALKINEIIYKNNGRWCIRDVKLSYKHPSDYIAFRPPPSRSMKVYKLFLDLYYDDFGTYRNVYHSLGGVYLQFGNMPAHQRKLLKNHFVLGFVPFGGSFDEFMQPFILEMKKFEQGKKMKVLGQDAWVIASLGVVTSNLPQGNDMAGVLRHNAKKGCRTCLVPHELLTSHDQDIPQISRYHHITDDQFKEISQEDTVSTKRQLCTKYGLRLQPGILDKLKWERHLQSPQDVYHATAGKVGRLLKLMCESLSREGERDFINIWKDFEKPKKWSSLPNPISHHASFMMSDYLRLAMVMPYILHRFLKVSSLKENEVETIKRRIEVPRADLVPKAIISCWVRVAITMKAVFSSEFTVDGYENLKNCLQEELLILPKVININLF
jgi:hypothetical protein